MLKPRRENRAAIRARMPGVFSTRTESVCLDMISSVSLAESSSLSPKSGRTSRAAMISSLEVPAATIGQTIASSWTMKSTRTGRSLTEFASSMTLSRSAGSSQRIA
ncbi:hypothetical protein SANTM175S_00991 [Streptomyces antimycoticus]